MTDVTRALLSGVTGYCWERSGESATGVYRCMRPLGHVGDHGSATATWANPSSLASATEAALPLTPSSVCTGASDCPAATHIHGCFAERLALMSDTGKGLEGGRGLEAAASAAVVERLREATVVLKAFESIAINGTVCTPPNTWDDPLMGGDGSGSLFDIEALNCRECKRVWRNLAAFFTTSAFPLDGAYLSPDLGSGGRNV